MNLILNTATGQLSPAGVAVQLAKGPTAVTLQFTDGATAALLPDGHPIALKIYRLSDQETPVATFTAWTALAAQALYKGTPNPLAESGLAWLADPLYVARISYGTPNVDSALFHLRIGGTPTAQPAPPQLIITQPTGPTEQSISLANKTGNVKVETYGNRVIRAAGNVVGLQLYANTAPEGADMLIELRKNGVGTGAVATLSADAKSERTPFDPVVAVAIDDVLDISVTQIGSTKAGGYLSVEAEIELT